ncbi:MAG: hypothetical protein WDO56_32330 [Gammaproteobacteria bacterium]
MGSLDGEVSDSWTGEIEASIEKLRFFPFRCPVVCQRGGRPVRRLVVNERFLVYYMYFASRDVASPGRISIRAVSHAARRNPLSGVRELGVETDGGRHWWMHFAGCSSTFTGISLTLAKRAAS